MIFNGKWGTLKAKQSKGEYHITCSLANICPYEIENRMSDVSNPCLHNKTASVDIIEHLRNLPPCAAAEGAYRSKEKGWMLHVDNKKTGDRIYKMMTNTKKGRR